MKKEDEARFVAAFAVLSEIYDKTLSPALRKFYLSILKDFTIEQVEGAVKQIISTHKYGNFPKPADFLDILAPKRDLQSDSRVAFKELHDRLRIQGSYENLAFEDPIVVAVVEHYGGLGEYGHMTAQMDERSFNFHENEFVKLYVAYGNRPDKCRSNVLYGITANSNFQLGYNIPNDRLALTDKGERISIPEWKDKQIENKGDFARLGGPIDTTIKNSNTDSE